jgi:UDP-glucose 4-epimerase
MASKTSRAWITGARGFIGRHLGRHLSRAGHEVYGIGHGIWPDSERSVWGLTGWVNGDINAANLETILGASGPPAYVFHLAGGAVVGSSISNPLEDFSRTVVTTARLLDWLRVRAPDVHIVVVSSAAVYGSRYENPIGDDEETQPVSPYGHHKLMMEQLCRSYAGTFGLRCTIVRLFSVFGPWLRKQLLWDLCCALAKGGDAALRLGGSGLELRDWMDVSDVSRLLALAATIEKARPVVANGGSGISTSVRDFAQLVVQAWGTEVGLQFSGERRAGDPPSLVARPGLMADLGFRPEVAIVDGVARYVEWYRSALR